jgi:DNA invertase Pin-like site-specific DNA recombinase
MIIEPKKQYRVAIYARVSTGHQEFENQLPILRGFADSHGSIVKEYTDQESGGTADRQQFKLMMKEAHQRKFDLLVFWALDRLSREGALETLKHLEYLESNGVSVKSYSEPFLDSAGFFKDAFVSLIAALAKQQRIKIGDNTKLGLARAVKNGRTLGRRPLTSTQLERILELNDAGHSVRKIAAEVKVGKSSVSNYLKSLKKNEINA